LKKKLAASSYSLIVIMAAMLLVIVLALGMPLVSKLLPLLFSSLIIILAAIKLWYDIWAGDKTEETVIKDIAGLGEESEAPLRAYLLIGAWVVGFLLAIYLLGLLIACPLLVFSYMKTHGTRWLTAIISTIVIIITIYFGFQTALGIDLYPGLLFKWLGG